VILNKFVVENSQKKLPEKLQVKELKLKSKLLKLSKKEIKNLL